MAVSNFAQMRARYQKLTEQFRAGALSRAQYVSALQALRWQDESGSWWSLRPSDGAFLRYNGVAWVEAVPPLEPNADAPSAELPGGTEQEGSPAGTKSPLRALVPFAGLIVASSCSVLWGLYTLLRLGQGEPADLLTPVLVMGLTLALWVFQRPLGALIRPVTMLLRPLPRPLLVGAALAFPVLTGLVCSSLTTYGYGAMRWTAVVSMLGAYVLTYRPKEGT